MLQTAVYTLSPDSMKVIHLLTWDDIGCGYGDRLVVETLDGELYEGVLVDFEIDFDGSLGGDSISIKMPERPGVTVSFREDEIARITPL